MNTTTIEINEGGRYAWFNEKILLGLGVKGYLKSLATPWTILASAILGVGLPLLVYRFAFGLGAVTNLSQTQPWGIWIGFDMMTGIVLAAGGFTIGATVQLFGLKDFRFMLFAGIFEDIFGGFGFRIVDQGRWRRRSRHARQCELAHCQAIGCGQLASREITGTAA